MITIFINIFSNLLETWLFFYLIRNRLLLKKNNRLITICFITQFILISIMNVIQIDSVIRMILTLIIQIGNSFLLSQSKKTVTFFWGSIYMIIVIFSDACTFQLGAIFTNYSALERLYNKPISLILTFVYLYICIIMVLIISKKHYQKFMFPWYYYILLVLLFFLVP